MCYPQVSTSLHVENHYFHPCNARVSLFSHEKTLLNNRLTRISAFLCIDNQWIDLGDQHYGYKFLPTKYVLVRCDLPDQFVVPLYTEEAGKHFFFSLNLETEACSDLKTVWHLNCWPEGGKLTSIPVAEILKKTGFTRCCRILMSFPLVCASNKSVCYIYIRRDPHDSRQILRLHLDHLENALDREASTTNLANVAVAGSASASTSSDIENLPLTASLVPSAGETPSAAQVPISSSQVSLRFGWNGALISNLWVVTAKSCGVISGIVFRGARYNVTTLLSLPRQDVQFFGFETPIVLDEPHLRMHSPSHAQEDGERSAKSPRLSEEIEVFVVGAPDSSSLSDVNEQGVPAKKLLRFGSHVRQVRGYIYRSELGLPQLHFSAWKELMPKDNGAGVYIKNERGEPELIGIISAKLMQTHREAPVLYLGTPEMQGYVRNICQE